MEVPNVEQLLDYVFTPEDFSDDPSTQEYKKLCRVMSVMVNFYKRGEKNKGLQYEAVQTELTAVERELRLLAEQERVLTTFPAYHPKRSYYETELQNERDEIVKYKARYEAQAQSFRDLHEWGKGIVETVEWLEGNLKHYANQKLGMAFDVPPMRVSTEQYKKYKRGLEEITYNLQESQDFFDASLDGRLHTYHGIERDMIQAQIDVVRAFPDEAQRREHVLAELEKDLAFVEGNMEENPKVRNHRERMQRMHKDFFAILKWQRKKMAQILDMEPEKIDGDVAQLKKELEEMKLNAERKAFQSKFSAAAESAESAQGGECPIPKDAVHSGLSGDGQCPVQHGQASALLQQKKAEEIAAKKSEGLIHKVYDPK